VSETERANAVHNVLVPHPEVSHHCDPTIFCNGLYGMLSRHRDEADKVAWRVSFLLFSNPGRRGVAARKAASVPAVSSGTAVSLCCSGTMVVIMMILMMV
jgi:hypothetical protein